MTAQVPYDPRPALDRVALATDRLLDTIAGLDDASLAEPSLLPGWTRGHVCAHVAGNAESLVNLVTWARTGVETPAYASDAARTAAIEAGSTRSPAEQVATVHATARAFADAVATHPADRWEVEVRWRGGAVTAVRDVLWAREREVEIHHVDLGLAYSPANWTDEFTGRVLANVTRAFAALDPAPSFDVRTTDTERVVRLRDEPAQVVVSGPQAAVLAWLIGRSPGDGLVAETATGDHVTLPDVPDWL